MTAKQLAEKLAAACGERTYSGDLTAYTVKSITEARSNYPVSNLIAYCQGIGVQFVMTDMATDESYDIDSIHDTHSVIDLLMKRYQVDVNLIYRKTAMHYTPPKEDFAPLSVKTLLAVCSVIHCKLDFIPFD